MLTPDGAGRLRQLCGLYTVGVWGSARKGDPDSLAMARHLIDAGVSFVNTDLPRGYFDAEEAEESSSHAEGHTTSADEGTPPRAARAAARAATADSTARAAAGHEGERNSAVAIYDGDGDDEGDDDGGLDEWERDFRRGEPSDDDEDDD